MGKLLERVNKQISYSDIRGRALSYNTYRDFVSSNVNDLKRIGIEDMESAESFWKDAHYSLNRGLFLQIDIGEAVKEVKERFPANLLHGWFRAGDSSYKPNIERVILKDRVLHNAGINIAHYNYNSVVGKVSFDRFIKSKIKVFRGGSSVPVKDDVFISYSFSKGSALKFGENVVTKMVVPKQTLGSYQTTGELEILVPV